MAIPVQSGSTNHIGFKGELPSTPSLPAGNSALQSVLDRWWAVARQKLQSDRGDIQATIEDIYRKLAAIQPIQEGDTIVTHPTVDPGYYLYEQRLPSDSWLIQHSLGQQPAIALLTNEYEVMEGSVIHIDENTAKATFNYSLTGFAICT